MNTALIRAACGGDEAKAPASRRSAGALQSLPSVVGLGLATLLASCAAPVERVADRAEEVRTVILRGRVICLAEELHQRYGAELPTNHEHVWALQASNGRGYTLLRSHFSEAIWLDERVRARELELKARLFPGTQALEVQRLRSVVRGVVQDLYYYCDICHIQSVTPEQCACCQGPVELVEKPLERRSD